MYRKIQTCISNINMIMSKIRGGQSAAPEPHTALGLISCGSNIDIEVCILLEFNKLFCLRRREWGGGGGDVYACSCV